ncbi:MAG: zinc ABC transporter solute-binding protein [Hyphomicrobiaceae bacterium]|nr:zinc ABC transporter solute-binding protein [Hyphomicrobiaceae bacterium]
MVIPRCLTTIALTLGAFAGVPGLATAQDAKPRVVVTIKPVHSLVAKVMGSTGTPALIVDGNASPHTYSLKPSDAKALTDAEIIFRVSERLEPFTAKIRNPGSRLVTLIEAKGVTTLKARAGGPFEKHIDTANVGKSHAHDHDAPAKGASLDGHIWLDPANAKAMLDSIAAALSTKAPSNTATYKANADAAKQELDALSLEIAMTLKGLENKPYIVFHDAYQYFERRFGLTVAGSITADPDTPLSGKRLSDVRKKITSLGATCVFGEPNFDTKVITTVTEGTTAKTGTLDPEGASLKSGVDFYEALLRKLAADAKACLTGN